MDVNSDFPFGSIARNFQICLADFPVDLRPEHLDLPAGEQTIVYEGLHTLRKTIGGIYAYFAQIPASTFASDPKARRWLESDYCGKSIEAPVMLLWALGVSGKVVQGPDGAELPSDRADLDRALKACGCREPDAALAVLRAVGFRTDFRGADGLACAGGYKQCVELAVRYPGQSPEQNEPLLRALTYYAPRLPKNKTSQKGIIFEIFMRADFRPLQPGYKIRMPHLPMEEEEVTRTFTPATLVIWREIASFMASRHPEYRLFFRVPRIHGRGWVADYSIKDNDYGAWSIFVEENGLYVRIVFNDKTLPNLFEHIRDFSPRFQESYLNAVACKDCVRCGKHIFYTHGDHMHRLCKSPWYFSPYLSLADLPDIERLVDCRLAN